MAKKGKSKKKNRSYIRVEPAPRMTPELKERGRQYDESQSRFKSNKELKSTSGARKSYVKRSYKS